MIFAFRKFMTLSGGFKNIVVSAFAMAVMAVAGHVVAQASHSAYRSSPPPEQQQRQEVDAMNRHAFLNKDSSIAIYYQISREAFEKAKAINYTRGMADAELNIGVAQLYYKYYLTALGSYFHALKLYENISCDSGMIATNSAIGQAFVRLNREDRALAYFLKGFQVAFLKKDTISMMILDGYMGEIYLHEGQKDKAYRCQMDALLYAANCGNENMNAQVYRSAGTFYLRNGDYVKAKLYYNEAINCLRKLNYATELGSMYTLIAHTYEQEKDYKNALKYNLMALADRKKSGREGLYASSLLNTGYTYLLLKSYDSSYYFLTTGLALAEKLKEQALLEYGYQHLYDYYDLKHDWKKALDSYKRYKSAGDSVALEKEKDAVLLFEVNNTLSETEKKNQILQNENSIQKLNLRVKNLQIFFLFVIVVLSVIFIFFIYQLYLSNKRSRLKLKETNEHLDEEITARKKIEEDLRKSEKLYRFLADNSLDVIAKMTRYFEITYISPSCFNMLGYSQKEILDIRKGETFIHPDNRAQLLEDAEKMMLEKTPLRFLYQIRHKNGNYFWAETNVNPIIDERTGEVRELLAVIRDFTVHVEHEKILVDIANQKEVLVSEIHHRVKNYFAVLLSLMDLEKRESDIEEVHHHIANLKYRTKTMGLIHDQLYNSRNISKLSFDKFLLQLTGEISSALMTEGVHMYTDISPCFLHVRTAMPLGLIVNELLINTFKYAFDGRETGNVWVAFHILQQPDDEELPVIWELTVKDDGIGLPDGFQLEKTETLGLRLIRMLTDQVDARIEYEACEGTCFRITNSMASGANPDR
jgi:PAS domain S-box-containing protein